jgi:hypothetical protein
VTVDWIQESTAEEERTSIEVHRISSGESEGEVGEVAVMCGIAASSAPLLISVNESLTPMGYRSFAVARPMPDAAPEIVTTLPRREE